MPTEQNFQNHARLHTPFHFVLAPLLLIHLVYRVRLLGQDAGWERADDVLVAIALFMLAFFARTYALKAQDRVIRLEERMRYARVLSPELARRADGLTEKQMVALRFASDGELAGLIAQVLDSKLVSGKEIKGAIRQWRADHFRV